MAQQRTAMRRRAINEVVTRKYTINIHKRTLQALTEIQKFATKEMGTPETYVDTKLDKAIWAKKNKECPILYVGMVVLKT